MSEFYKCIKPMRREHWSPYGNQIVETVVGSIWWKDKNRLRTGYDTATGISKEELKEYFEPTTEDEWRKYSRNVEEHWPYRAADKEDEE